MAAMSDDDHDIDIESDDSDDSDSALGQSINTQNYSQAEKRAHHNALERKRRDHIKDSFSSLKEAIPDLQGEKVASRAQILKKTADYIELVRERTNNHQEAIDELKLQNNILEHQIAVLGDALNEHFPENCDITLDVEKVITRVIKECSKKK